MTALKTVLAAAVLVGTSSFALAASPRFNEGYAGQYEFLDNNAPVPPGVWIEGEDFEYEGRNSVVYGPMAEGPFVDRYGYVVDDGPVYGDPIYGGFPAHMGPHDDIAERSGR